MKTKLNKLSTRIRNLKEKESAMAPKGAAHGKLSIHTENIFPIIKKWLYSEHDIFLREVISNATDAMNKRIALHPELKDEMKIEIKLHKSKKTIEVIDHGIGMTADEVKKYINQIAFSGAEDFVEKFKDKQANIIGHFGLGFYSTFMVSDTVEIDSLSYQEGAEPTNWECDGDIDYKLKKGSRKEVGTTITMHLNKDSEEYLEEAKIKELVEKYSNFVPFPIYVNKEKEPLNQKEALWLRKPKDVTEEEYKEFYRTLFHDWKEPLFWIHLNVDFPFNLKGILYFPKISNQIDVNQGKVKLFCNNVFVADDLKGIIPEFLLLLKGGIDIPDIPLNVSRSYLQQDKTVSKISQYIIKKTADGLKEMFTDDRKKYETSWADINNFIKYGMLTDEKFYDAMKDHIIFKSSQGDYVTLGEYKDRNATDDKKRKIYYASSEDTQVTYLKLMKEQGIEVLFADSVLDSHLFQQLESKMDDLSFVRIDSEINDNLVNDDTAEVVDANNRTQSERIKELFDTTLNEKVEASFGKDAYGDFIKKFPEAATTLTPYIRTEDDFTYIKPYDIPQPVRTQLGDAAFKEILDKVYLEVTTQTKHLKSKEIPAMIVFNEFMRRFQEMNSLNQMGGSDMLKNHEIIVNPDNPTIQKIIAFADEGDWDKAKLLINYVHELTLLEQKQFNGKELQSFIEKTNTILGML
jgi:molecular chaperone HtpG